MLVPAILHKDELLKKFSEFMYTYDYFFYTGYAGGHQLPKIEDADDSENWVSVNSDGKVLGYLSYFVDRVNDSVNRFGLFSFIRNSPVFVLDCYRKLKSLVQKYRRIEWQMIGGNPVELAYDLFCEKCGGRKITLRKVVKSPKGVYLDEMIYEVIRDDCLNAKGDYSPMTLDEAILHAEEVAKNNDYWKERYDDASGYTRTHNEKIRTTDAKKCEQCAAEHRQIAEWLKELKEHRERMEDDLK